MVFKTIFSDKNTLIGVTTVTAILMFMSINLTISPVKNTARLIVLNLLTGIAAYVAHTNMWIGLPVNFIMMFILTYASYYNLKSPLYLPFSLQYLFLLATPVTSGEIGLRLLSLLVAPIGIMVVQMLINRNKITKSGNKLIISICNTIINKMDSNENSLESSDSITKDVTTFKKIVYDNIKNYFYITEEGRIKLDIGVMLEKLSQVREVLKNIL